MHGANPSQYTPQQDAHEAFAEQERGLRDISLEQLSRVFTTLDILAIDDYQRQTNLERLATNPLPDDISLKYGMQSDMLQDNTSTYDEEGEDILFEDALICRIVHARRGQSNNRELTALFRVRRTVVAFILFHWNSIEEGEQPLRAS